MKGQMLDLRIGLLLAALLATPLGAQDTLRPQSAEARRQAAHAVALARIGRSGLRSLLSASGNLGDLQNRAGSYRLALQMERTRTGRLEGRIAALDRALADSELPSEERTALIELREAATAELAAVPRYEAAYTTTTVQAEALVPFGFIGNRPMFLVLRGRGHARWGEDDGLTVFSEGASVGPLLVGSGDRWLVSPGLALTRTDVKIGPFDGRSGATSVGPRVDAGAIFGDAWSAAVQLAHVWSHGRSTIMRPRPDGTTEVRSRGWSRTTSAKVELKGRLSLTRPGRAPVRIRPRIGAFLISTRGPPTTDRTVEDGPGSFAERESVAALRAGAGIGTTFGDWSPSLYLGWERELIRATAVLIDDPQAFLASVGVSWSWSRGRRLSLDYAAVRGLDGLRRVSELTLVLILDG